MRLIGFVFLLAFATPVLTFPWTKYYYTRIIADVYCHDVPVLAMVEVIEADDSEAEHDHILSFPTSPNNMDNHLDITIRGSEDKDPWRYLKPQFFLRIHYDCGCGKYYDTTFIPSPVVFENEKDAKDYPFELHVELSKCRRS